MKNNQGGREINKIKEVELDSYSPTLTMLHLEAQIKRQKDHFTIRGNSL